MILIFFHLSPSIPFSNAPPHKSKNGSGKISIEITLSNFVYFVEKNDMRFYGALERQVWDQIQLTTYFKFHHGHHQRRYIVRDDQEHQLYFEREKFGLNLVTQRKEVLSPWSMMNKVWKGEQIAKDLLKGWIHHWKAKPAEIVYLH